jgi:molybdopterin-containing oxidoreductase family iron-sulfur binding subunit
MTEHEHEHEHEHDGHAADATPRARRVSALRVMGQPEPPRFWRSLEERDGDAAVARAAGREFPAGASEMPEGSVSRRGFVQLLGASLAVTGAACYRPTQKIVPYVKRPPEVTPGNPLHFATAYGLEGYANGLIVESHAGRPTKVEGNPDHPATRGAGTSVDQALVLGLFDDDRAKHMRHKGMPIAWRTLLAEIARRSEALAADGGAKLRFLVPPDASPLLADLRARVLAKFPRAKFVAWSAVANDGAVEGARLVYGRLLEPRFDLEKADVIAALDSDFLADGPEQINLSRQFAARRVPGDMNRLYVAEPCPTVTGGMADHRTRVRGGDMVAVAQALAAELARIGVEGLAPFAALPKASGATFDGRFVMALAKDLAKSRGKCLVVAGRRQPAAVHALCHAINQALGNVGATVSFWTPLASEGLAGVDALRALVEDIAAGQVDTLVITASNPVYGAPADFKLGKLLARVPLSLYVGLYDDETAAAVTTFVPSAHPLESWGDARALDGTVSLVQPLIYPLWSGLGAADVLAAFVGEGDAGAHQLLRAFWQRKGSELGLATAAEFETKWEAWLAKGVIDNTAGRPESVSADLAAAAGALAPQLQKLGQARGQGLELAFAVDPKVFDGRFANNAWLQELPDPVSKITWDNAVLLSPATAEGLKLATGDVVRLEIGDRQVTGPVYVQAGHVDEAVTVALGYGTPLGAVSKGVGFNAGALRVSAAPWFDRGAQLTRTARRHRFGTTQVHWTMEGRDPVIVGAAAELQKPDSPLNEKLGRNHPAKTPLDTLHEPVDYSEQPYKWGMAIDLSKCTGCGACVVACQAENNIPVVGRDNVRIGREMHWIRIDRYFEGPAEDPQMVTQPVMCVHCETAPCEYVCPVNATVHSDEGLNEMVYNRCIGTRYCSNNCPYKARRFNFLDYYEKPTPVSKMATNPDVTVRSRGVMEKCTYCVQRIERARIDARIEGRAIREDEVQSACQQVCPAGAIVFGSLNDQSSRVARAHQDERRYDLLHELSTRPRTIYLARIRNPNPELA